MSGSSDRVRQFIEAHAALTPEDVSQLIAIVQRDEPQVRELLGDDWRVRFFFQHVVRGLEQESPASSPVIEEFAVAPHSVLDSPAPVMEVDCEMADTASPDCPYPTAVKGERKKSSGASKRSSTKRAGSTKAKPDSTALVVKKSKPSSPTSSLRAHSPPNTDLLRTSSELSISVLSLSSNSSLSLSNSSHSSNFSISSHSSNNSSSTSSSSSSSSSLHLERMNSFQDITAVDPAFATFFDQLRTELDDVCRDPLHMDSLQLNLNGVLFNPRKKLEKLRNSEPGALEEALQSASSLIRYRQAVSSIEAFYVGGVLVMLAQSKSPAGSKFTIRSPEFIQACSSVGLHARSGWTRVSFYFLVEEFPRLLLWPNFSLSILNKHGNLLRQHLRTLCGRRSDEEDFWKDTAPPAAPPVEFSSSLLNSMPTSCVGDALTPYAAGYSSYATADALPVSKAPVKYYTNEDFY